MQRLRALTRPMRALRRGGGGHSHHAEAHGHGDHHMSEAAARYEAETPRLFGEQPLPAGQQRKWENWEMTFYVVAAATVLMAIAGASREDTNPRHWAKDEAAERMRRREAGLPVELGVNYAALRVMKERGAITEEEAETLEGGAVVPRYVPKLA